MLVLSVMIPILFSGVWAVQITSSSLQLDSESKGITCDKHVSNALSIMFKSDQVFRYLSSVSELNLSDPSNTSDWATEQQNEGLQYARNQFHLSDDCFDAALNQLIEFETKKFMALEFSQEDNQRRIAAISAGQVTEVESATSSAILIVDLCWFIAVCTATTESSKARLAKLYPIRPSYKTETTEEHYVVDLLEEALYKDTPESVLLLRHLLENYLHQSNIKENQEFLQSSLLQDLLDTWPEPAAIAAYEWVLLLDRYGPY